MFSSQTVLGTTRPIIVSRTSKNQTVNGTAHIPFVTLSKFNPLFVTLIESPTIYTNKTRVTK
jgi:hypothetical protein